MGVHICHDDIAEETVADNDFVPRNVSVIDHLYRRLEIHFLARFDEAISIRRSIRDCFADVLVANRAQLANAWWAGEDLKETVLPLVP